MTINWNEFFSTEYWFALDRAMIHPTDKIIFGFGAAIFILGVLVLLARMVSKNNLLKPMLGRIAAVFIWVGLLEILWYFLRIQYVHALGSRMAALIVGLVGLAFLYKPVKYFFKQYRQDQANFNKQQIKDKYLNLK
jgi:hypothetical protein